MIYKLNVKALYCVGDIHGAMNGIGNHIKRYDLRDCALVFCGDVGFGFEAQDYYERVYRKIRGLLSSRNVYLFFVRGNHDCPEFYDGKRIAHKRFVAVADYSVIQTFEMDDGACERPVHSVLCVGGAISVDRIWRKQRMEELAFIYVVKHCCDLDAAKSNLPRLWWENEAPTFDAMALDGLRESGVRIDTVCTHTCPSFCEPLTKKGLDSFAEYDPQVIADADSERQTMDRLWERLRADGHPLSWWYYGHYHFHHCDEIDGVRFGMLDMERDGTYDMVEVMPKGDG